MCCNHAVWQQLFDLCSKTYCLDPCFRPVHTEIENNLGSLMGQHKNSSSLMYCMRLKGWTFFYSVGSCSSALPFKFKLKSLELLQISNYSIYLWAFSQSFYPVKLFFMSHIWAISGEIMGHNWSISYSKWFTCWQHLALLYWIGVYSIISSAMINDFPKLGISTGYISHSSGSFVTRSVWGDFWTQSIGIPMFPNPTITC